MRGVKDGPSGTSGPEPDGLRQRSRELRNALLALHKALIDSERVEFEKSMGKIRTPNHFLQLLTSDPWFAWLQPLSSLIVSIDELLDQKEPLTTGDVEALGNQSSRLLVPAEHAHAFSGHYFEALQRDPRVVLAHAEAVRLLGPRKSPGPG
jgi:hypothetical protein